MSDQSYAGTTYQSETSKHRGTLGTFCEGYGVDVGFGGDPITPVAIRLDLPEPYARTGEFGVQLGGDCRDLRWFRDDVLDFVYSSHLLEDFPEEETELVMKEWVRVLRPGGRLVLLLPDQQRYVRYCRAAGLAPNAHHSIDELSLPYIREVAERIGYLEHEASFPELDEYSFGVVFKKTAPTSATADTLAEARATLDSARADQQTLRERLRQCEAELERIGKHPAVAVYRRVRRLFAQ